MSAFKRRIREDDSIRIVGIGMKTILFVCIHNAGRSQIAEALFNQLARNKARALSAGTQPADTINPVVVKAMREIGIDMSHNKPKALTFKMMEKAGRVVTMGCRAEAVCPATLVQTEDWVLEDPEGKTIDQVREIRDAIKSRVLQLLNEIA